MSPISGALFHSIVESIHEGLFITDMEDRVNYVNSCFTAMLGYTLEDLGDRPLHCHLLPPERWQEMENRNRSLHENIAETYQIQLKRKDGTCLWAQIKGSPLRDESDEIVGTLGLITDISEQKISEESRQKLLEILEGTTDFVSMADRNGCAVYINRAGLQLIGLNDGEYAGTSIEIWHPEWANRKIIEEGIPTAAREGVWTGETAFLDKEKREVPMSQLILAHKDKTGKVEFISTIARDISENKAADRKIEEQNRLLEEQKRELEKANALLSELATVDGLTGLKNQRAFYERLADVAQYSIRYYVSHSLLIIDVDQFKEYNDAFGHVAGDDVLKKVAEILLEQTREADFVARYGGEEFAIILPLANREESRLTAERIRRAVAVHPWPLRPVTISGGVATAIGNRYEIRDFVATADQALYESKRRGRNRITCADDFTGDPEPKPTAAQSDALYSADGAEIPRLPAISPDASQEEQEER